MSPTNLLRPQWVGLDSDDLRLLLAEYILSPGQYSGDANDDALYLPLAGEAARLRLRFMQGNIVAVEPGPAFDDKEWEQVALEIETAILTGPTRVGRGEYSFVSRRVDGWWRGGGSGVQILPPPKDAPSPIEETGDHPFLLEFPLKTTHRWQITNRRRLREHRTLTRLLNVLLEGSTSYQLPRSDHLWVATDVLSGKPKIEWAQAFYFAPLGDVVRDELTDPEGPKLIAMEPGEYYTLGGSDGHPLRVPTDLDERICQYQMISTQWREKFDRATFWLDLASRQWNMSLSASYASLVSAIESLTVRGDVHGHKCPECDVSCQHEVPGATQRFREFLERYAPGGALSGRRSEMYGLRSGILHGRELMKLDEDRAFGWDPPYRNERQLHDELWSLARVAVRWQRPRQAFRGCERGVTATCT